MDALGPWHRRIHADSWQDIFVVGDVHGCLPALETLLETLEIGSNDLVVFVGDLIRKGPDSRGVVEYVRERPNMVAVRGNNEQKVLDGRKTIPSLTDEDLAYLRQLPVAISFEDCLVVHGGINPEKPLYEHAPDDLLTMRSLTPENGYDRPYWFEEYQGPPRVFFGHTVLEEPVEREWAVGLDTGCVYGGALTAYDYRRDQFISVPATTHKERSSESIVFPRATPDE